MTKKCKHNWRQLSNKPIKHEDYQAKHSQYAADHRDGKFYMEGTKSEDGRLTKCYILLQNYHKGRLLDIGGGSGQFSNFLKHESTVMDICEDVKKAKRGVLASASEKFPFEDGFFDYIFAGEIIEHIIDTDFFLEECKRVLRDSGKLILTVPNLASLGNRFLLLFGKQPKWVDYNCSGAGHVRAYTPKMIINQIKNHGFHIEKIDGSWIQPISFFKGFGIWLGSVFPRLSAQIIVVAVKM